MSNNNLFRYGGIAAIASAVLYIISLGLNIAGSTSLGTPVYWLSSILLLVALIVLTMSHSASRNPGDPGSDPARRDDRLEFVPGPNPTQ